MREIAPTIEDRGIDEIYVDLSDAARRRTTTAGAPIGTALKAAVRERTGLTCSIGITPNKLLSKLASELDKPDGLTLLGHDDVAGAHLAARRAQGQRHRPEGRREARRASASRRSATSPPPIRVPARQQFGKSFGAWLHEASHGRDERAGRHLERARSRSAARPRSTATCTRCATAPCSARSSPSCASGSPATWRAKSYAAKTIGIKLRFDDFQIATRDLTLPAHTLDAREIRRAAGSCLKRVDLSAAAAPDRRARQRARAARRPGRAARCRDRAPAVAVAAHEPAGEYSLPLFDDAS